MYHDALQSGLKAFGFDRGVTVQGGLTVPVTTTAHGSAFAIAGKNEAAANPKANATTAATKPGGLIPKYPAIQTAKRAEILAAISSAFSLISG